VGFDLSDYPCEPERPYRVDGVLRLISIGRLSEEKGLILALRALAELVAAGEDQVHYTIVGLGNQEGVLRDFVTRHGLDRFVEFAGEQDKAGVVAHLARSDVLLLPSVVTDTWAETQAGVVQEAMLMRALVVGTRAGGVPESTAEVLHQFLVEPGDASAIAAMIRRIAALPTIELARLGEAARAFAAGRFSIESTGAQLIARALRRQPGPAAARDELTDLPDELASHAGFEHVRR
jgi:colanic acid/amylovoran biosynthesis glycosyltransferase